MFVQHYGKRIADRAENGGVVRPGIPVELVRCTEEFVSLGHGHARERQPVAAVCRRDVGELYSMVCEPGVNEPERLWVRRNKFSDPFL